jgi:hypothetical protein
VRWIRLLSAATPTNVRLTANGTADGVFGDIRAGAGSEVDTKEL